MYNKLISQFSKYLIHFKPYLKVIFFLVGLYVLYYHFNNYSEGLKNLENFKINYIFLSIGLFFMLLRHFFLAARIFILTSSYHSSNLMKKFISFEFKLLFYELIVPAPNIEDVARFFFIKKNIGTSKIQTLYILTLNRVIGIFTLLIFLSATLIFTKTFLIKLDVPIFLLQNGIIMFITIILLIVLVYKLILKINVSVKLQKVIEDFNVLRISYKNLLVAISFSVLQLLVWAIAVKFIFWSVNISLDFIFIISAIPLMIISFTIPVSYQGLGMPEATLLFYGMFFYKDLNLVNGCILHFLLYLLIICFGGLLYLLHKNQTNSKLDL
jgi:uncharacterized membrane protein YbhN (UPF0104 family)